MIGPAQRENIDIVRGAEDPRGHVGEPRIALLEQFEYSAAIVVGDHNGEVLRSRLSGTDQQPRGVMDEGQITEKRDRPGGVRQRGADRRRDGAVDTGHPAVGPHRDALGIEADQGGVAYRV